MSYYNESMKQEMKNEKNFETNNMMMEGGSCCHGMMPMSMPMPMNNVCCPPIYECPQERVCHRYTNYEVPQE